MPGPPGRSPYPTRNPRTSSSNASTAATTVATAVSSTTSGVNSPRRRSGSNTFHTQNASFATGAGGVVGSGWHSVREPTYHSNHFNSNQQSGSYRNTTMDLHLNNRNSNMMMSPNSDSSSRNNNMSFASSVAMSNSSVTPQMGDEGYSFSSRRMKSSSTAAAGSLPKHFTFHMTGHHHPSHFDSNNKQQNLHKNRHDLNHDSQNDDHGDMGYLTNQNSKQHSFMEEGIEIIHKDYSNGECNDVKINTNSTSKESTSHHANVLNANSPPTQNHNDAGNDHIRLLAQKALDTHTTAPTATFYASILYTRTNLPKDAFLYAKALAANQESKRAIFLLEQSGLLPFPQYSLGSAYDNNNNGPYNNMMKNIDIDHQPQKQQNISIKMYIEAALLASKCLCGNGDYEEAASLLEEASRYPHDSQQFFHYNNRVSSIIEDGSDPQLFLLAKYIPKTAGEIHVLSRLACARGKIYNELSNPTKAVGWLKAALQLDTYCVEAFNYLFDRRLLSVGEEQTLVDGLQWDCSDTGDGLLDPRKDWLRDYYRARVSIQLDSPFQTSHNSMEGDHDDAKQPHEQAQHMNTKMEFTGDYDDHYDEMKLPQYPIKIQSPSMQVDASTIIHHQTPSSPKLFCPPNSNHKPVMSKIRASKVVAINSKNITKSKSLNPLVRLQTIHNLSTSPLILALSAQRSYASHHIQYALQQCRRCQSLDPLNPNIAFTHAASLFALSQKRELYHLAHALVNANPRAAIGWFTVGCYYMACHKYEIAQKHFCRATRLDPKCAEAWIGFGCAFAAADESDQAMASFRAAQRLYQGSHMPILYMGMEYLRTNHLSLAGHFLGTAGKMNSVDPLSFNELGVCAFRVGNYEEAVSLFVHALRLSFRLVLLEQDNVDTENGKEQALNKKMNKLKEMAGLKESVGLGAINSSKENSIEDNNNWDVENMSDSECVFACRDVFWEPTVFNLGQSLRKIRRFGEAVLCFEKAVSLCPGNAASYAALGFTKHLTGDIDGAIESYHQALSMKPDDTFSGEMLNRALHEEFTNPDRLIDVTAQSKKMSSLGSGRNIQSSFTSPKSKSSFFGSMKEYGNEAQRKSTMSIETEESSNLSLDVTW